MASFRDRLSHLSIAQAAKLLGARGHRLISRGGRYDIDISSQVQLGRDVLRVTLQGAVVSLIDDDKAPNGMRLLCSECKSPCEHAGALLALVLEEKVALGLAAPPPEDSEASALSEVELVERELARREERARRERMRVRSQAPGQPWTDYVVTSHESGKSYRVALRGLERGESYCSCPDYRKNTLGTCKHIMRVTALVRHKFPSRVLSQPFEPNELAAYVRYGNDLELRLQQPRTLDPAVRRRFRRYLNRPIVDTPAFMKAVSRHMADGRQVVVYPDAERLIAARLHAERIRGLVAGIRRDPKGHRLRTELLREPLLPYQLDGIAFVVGAGRAVLADDMGLGKTIQAIGAAELFARECGISRVLIVCPASVKAQWRSEIDRFAGRPTQIVVGASRERAGQYAADAFFTICNYEQVIRDLTAIEQTPWDLIILDEGQRIKNWEAKTSQTIKGLRSTYALVLSGTPLENRLEELHSVVEFVDDRRLGPDFRFHYEHRLTDERGRTTGYGNLDALREKLRPLLLRRTRAQILKELPPRTTEVVRITPTAEQAELHTAQMRVISAIAKKPYVSEMDLLRLQKALLAARMCANSTYLVDKVEPGFSTKLQELAVLLPRLASEEGRKTVVFSEWTTMLGLIEKILKRHGETYVRLDGSVPQKKRALLVRRFSTDSACPFILMTNAGATGLNLQSANTVVNVDLPWNPAVLEQRIGRAHRMGQRRPVHVYLLVTEGTIEENMLGTLSLKKDLAGAALDIGSDITKVEMTSGMDELKKRLEVLLGEKPVANEDVSERMRVEEESARLARRREAEQAGGKLLEAAFSLLGTMLPAGEPSERTTAMRNEIRQGLEQCLEQDDDGSYSLRVRLADSGALDSLCDAVAGLIGTTKTERMAG
ncbi:MAG: helicase [Chitinivibrionales bacterium]|nr:helicase [Chitinivibrionales bacterium]